LFAKIPVNRSKDNTLLDNITICDRFGLSCDKIYGDTMAGCGISSPAKSDVQFAILDNKKRTHDLTQVLYLQAIVGASYAHLKISYRQE
jgi:hypothetical protein